AALPQWPSEQVSNDSLRPEEKMRNTDDQHLIPKPESSTPTTKAPPNTSICFLQITFQGFVPSRSFQYKRGEDGKTARPRLTVATHEALELAQESDPCDSRGSERGIDGAK